MVGGITTNLLYTVFESWLITEHRKRNFSSDKLEIVLRDSVIASNLSAIVSGMLAHMLAINMGNAGPFKGAVMCTSIALCLVMRWEENYGGDNDNVNVKQATVMHEYMVKAFRTIISNSKISRIGLMQGFAEGALQTFVFLWSPALRHFAQYCPDSCSSSIWGIVDNRGSCEPAYGLIFGAYMAAGVLGGLGAPHVRKKLSQFLLYSNPAIMTKGLEDESPHTVCRTPSLTTTVHSDSDYQENTDIQSFQIYLNGTNEKFELDSDHTASFCKDDFTFSDALSSDCSSSVEQECHAELMSDSKSSDHNEIEVTNEEEPTRGIELYFAIAFLISAGLLATPMIVSDSPNAFSLTFIAFLVYEIIVGMYLPFDGVIRTMYIPNESICSVHTMLRVIVNIAVAAGVISTNYITFTSAFTACSFSLVISCGLSLSLVGCEDWSAIRSRISTAKQKID